MTKKTTPPFTGSNNLAKEGTTTSAAAICRHPDRLINSSWCFTNKPGHKDSSPLAPSAFKGNATTRVTGSGLMFLFTEDKGVHQVRFKLPSPYVANGLSIRFKLSSWASLNYMAIGYNAEGTYQHVKLVNTLSNQWVDFSIGYADLAFGIQNDWNQTATQPISEIKIFFKGQPLPEGSTLELEEIICWRESETPPRWLSSVGHGDSREIRKTPRLPDALINKLYAYFEKCFVNSEHQIQAYLTRGTCPLYGGINLPWASASRQPETLASIGTYRFSWHALHPASMLMLYAQKHENISAVLAAREFVSQWLENSYFNHDADKKYAWYDHGTAERMLAFILMWDIGARYDFDMRFMSRLRHAMFKHAQLLASEVFYASHQLSRYHNHAWFQDTALLAAALAMSDLPCAESWACNAVARLEDQLEKLIIRDNGYSIFVENSIGYHQGVQRLISFAAELTLLSKKNSNIATIAGELDKFSQLLKYPDNRGPAQGDTFRKSNPGEPSFADPMPYKKSTVTVLPEAGYAIIKSNHERQAYMLCLFATALCQTHKHEDNLSLTLFMSGVEWLIDPSFYSHEYKNPLEKYLRSAWAHNNVAIKGVDYNLAPGHAKLTGGTKESKFYLEGTHSAYQGYGVSRSIEGNLDSLNVHIKDCVTGNTAVEAFTLFHCGEGVVVKPIENGVVLSHASANIVIKITSKRSFTITSGWCDLRDINGMTGLGFMQAKETTVIAFKLTIAEHSHFHITAESRLPADAT